VLKKALIVLFVFAAVPLFAKANLAHAAESMFFEFAPDYYHYRALNIASASTTYLLFQPQNDFLKSFDFWIDNAGSSGSVSFTLFDGPDVIAQKTVTAPHVPEIAGGSKFHVGLTSQVPTVNTKIYSLKISTSMPDLRLYYANTIDLLYQDEPYIPRYINGVVKLDSEEQDFSFKDALYEETESLPPVISNVTTTLTSPTTVKISFNANEPVDYRVEYKIVGSNATSSTNFTNSYKTCGEGIGWCALTLALAAGATYDYTIIARDEWGNNSMSTGEVTTSSDSPPVNNASSSPASSEPVPGTPPPVTTPMPPPTTYKFSIGDRVETTDIISLINVREAPSLAATVLGQQQSHALGTITGGPINSDIHIWWQVNYDTGQDGWTVEDYLRLAAISAPAPPPTNPVQTVGVTTLTPQASIILSPDGNGFSISWKVESGCETENGYFIDIFGNIHKNEYQYIVAACVHEFSVDNLPDDEYSISIYALKGSGKEKIAEGAMNTTKKVQVMPQVNPPASAGVDMKWLYIGGGVVVLLAAGIVAKILFFPAAD